MVGHRLANASPSTAGAFANATPPASTQGMLRMEEVDVPPAFVRSVLQMCDAAHLGFVDRSGRHTSGQMVRGGVESAFFFLSFK